MKVYSNAACYLWDRDPHTCFYDDICSVPLLNLATLFESFKNRDIDHEKL